MSSTNHTTNYNLPQFVGTDKPAWLGDVNPAMSAIDAQMKLNADAATAAAGAASTADDKAVAASNAAATADGKAETAQTTANGAVSRITALETALNINEFSTIGLANVESFAPVLNQFAYYGGAGITLAQNSEGSLFKMYGELVYQTGAASVTVSKTAIPGLSGYYGFKTTLHLNTAPTEAYNVKCAGTYARYQNNVVTDTYQVDFSVGTDGYIYIRTSSISGTTTYPANTTERWWFSPCLFFNADFGDSPE